MIHPAEVVAHDPTDLLDGQQWQNNYDAVAVQAIAQTRSSDAYNFLSVGINYNIGKHAVEPLWWLNPLDYAYNEINAPRHMKLPKPVLDDADGDGVTDQFDLEPNTPKGCPVDSHGVSRDTDGDGVPDFKDKELITPTQCQPVDADGVGRQVRQRREPLRQGRFVVERQGRASSQKSRETAEVSTGESAPDQIVT